MILGYGPLLVGHNHPHVADALQETIEDGWSYGAPTPLETKLGEKVRNLYPSMERLRFVNSGTEATMSALRLARGFTGRKKIIKFAGCYHGHVDSLLVKAGSGALTHGHPDSGGIPEEIAATTLIAQYNDLDHVRKLLEGWPQEVAGIIVEPVAGNMGVVPPAAGFLNGLRTLCDEHGALLIFDEVMTGFRVSLGGAQERYDVRPDITCLGKVIGGGLPVGAFGGRSDIMSCLAPEGPVYQAGTLSGNPLSMAAGIATLDLLEDGTRCALIEEQTERLAVGLREAAQRSGVKVTVQHVGSMLTMFFGNGPIQNLEDVQRCDFDQFKAFFHGMREHGVSIAPSQYEAWFLSTSHDEVVVDRVLAASRIVLQEIAALNADL
jgi:glutamate-1-semialdehyde 2,1-aminomutase